MPFNIVDSLLFYLSIFEERFSAEVGHSLDTKSHTRSLTRLGFSSTEGFILCYYTYLLLPNISLRDDQAGNLTVIPATGSLIWFLVLPSGNEAITLVVSLHISSSWIPHTQCTISRPSITTLSTRPRNTDTLTTMPATHQKCSTIMDLSLPSRRSINHVCRNRNPSSPHSRS